MDGRQAVVANVSGTEIGHSNGVTRSIQTPVYGNNSFSKTTEALVLPE